MKRILYILLAVILFFLPYILREGLPINPTSSVFSNIFTILGTCFVLFLIWLLCTILFAIISLITIGVSGFFLKRIAPNVYLDQYDVFSKDSEAYHKRMNVIGFLSMTFPAFAWWCYNIFQIYLMFQ